MQHNFSHVTESSLFVTRKRERARERGRRPHSESHPHSSGSAWFGKVHLNSRQLWGIGKHISHCTVKGTSKPHTGLRKNKDVTTQRKQHCWRLQMRGTVFCHNRMNRITPPSSLMWAVCGHPCYISYTLQFSSHVPSAYRPHKGHATPSLGFENWGSDASQSSVALLAVSPALDMAAGCVLALGGPQFGDALP